MFRQIVLYFRACFHGFLCCFHYRPAGGMSTSAAGEKLPPAITQKVLKPMERAQAWAGRQLNKAQQMIRELSVSHPDPRDIALQ
ncbi:unnamed protein product [Nippostrongylus brasiliensis]|uniref:Secreted protein n=1 Tax=Nippostrongylus brasiliensis TaxID=27835 RepID=A0A0N4XD45_NIPBR|nr:unnamed protein product [Nippostrongylus brasiliensis]